ncbi:MAG: polyprenyl synthetase family protein [Pseudomonadota bacterium]
MEFTTANSLIEDNLYSLEKSGETPASEFLNHVSDVVRVLIRNNSHGLLKEMSEELVSSEGKMLRPQFVRDLSLALNLPLSQSVGWAACCEILHSATLIHDDLQDGDTVRRGQPATWVKFGANQAINAGDFFLMLAPQGVLTSPVGHHKQTELLMLLSKMCTMIAAGQAYEIELRKQFEKEGLLRAYFDCIGGKTSRLFSGLARGVGVLAELKAEDLNQVEQVFFTLGQIFQVQDDILDLYGDKMRGECGCDIKEGKVSFLIAHHIEHNPDDFSALSDVLKKPREMTTLKDIEDIKRLMEQKQTLSLSIKFLNTQSTELLNHPLLLASPGLKKLVAQFLSSILEPIGHLGIREPLEC